MKKSVVFYPKKPLLGVISKNLNFKQISKLDFLPIMNTFFTADTHFGHANIIKYSKRPFNDTVEMNETIISNWNRIVDKGDMVYHLGDFCFGRNDSEFDLYLNKLNGLIILIKGNHDKLAWKNRTKFFASHDSYHEIEISGQSITLCHYAMRVWNKSHHGAWNLFGHSHGSLPDDPNSLSIDVGVDCHDFTPLSFQQIKGIMGNKHFKPIDHHGGTSNIASTPYKIAD